MIPLADLWLPIVVSAIFVFIASSVIHMALPIHKGDQSKLPNEAEVLAGLRAQNVPVGEYMFPCGESMKEMGSPEMKAKLDQGPVGWLTVIPNGSWGMGKALVQWFVYSLLIGAFVAYTASIAPLLPGASYSDVFRMTGTVAILGYAFSSVTNSIWKGVSWVTTAKFVFDGVVYGLVTAGTFGWLWPAAV